MLFRSKLALEIDEVVLLRSIGLHRPSIRGTTFRGKFLFSMTMAWVSA